MSSYYIPLPAAEYPRNALLDFSPIRQAAQDWRQADQDAYERKRQEEEKKYQRSRNALSDQMAEKKFQWETEDRNKPKLTEFDGNVGLYHPDSQSLSMLYKKPDDFARFFGDPSQPDNALSPRPTRSYSQDANLQTDYGSPAIAQQPSLNPMMGQSQSRPMAGIVIDQYNANPVMQTRQEPTQPQQQEDMVQIGNRQYTRAQALQLTGHPNAGIRNAAENAIKEFDAKYDTSSSIGRENVVKKYNMDPNDPSTKNYILTGKTLGDEKLTATDRKFVQEKRSALNAGDAAIESLNYALSINDKAYGGMGSGLRTYLGANAPDALPDFIADPKSAATTTLLDTTIKQNAITQLRAAFGGNPTEGERDILLEIGGSTKLTAEQRKQIYERAITLVKERIARERAELEDMVGGNYYKQMPEAKTGQTDLYDKYGLAKP